MVDTPGPMPKQPADEVLRAYTPRPAVRRLRPWAVAVIVAALMMLICGRLILKLFDAGHVPEETDIAGSRFRAPDDMLQRGPIGWLPTDYSFATPPPAQAEQPAPKEPQAEEVHQEPEFDEQTRRQLETLRQEMQAAMDSPILFSVSPSNQGAALATPHATTATESYTLDSGNGSAVDDQTRSDAQQRRFLANAAVIRESVSSRLQPPASPYELKAGAIIPAGLVTPINSDLPGDVIGQVTANVYDSISGRHLLVPQGTRIIGRYDSEVLNGQDRVLIAWQRLILPNGYSINLEAMPGTDAAGVSGMADRVDFHGTQLAGATLLSTLVALGGNFAATTNREQEEVGIVANTVAQQASRVAQRIIDRQLNVKPTILVRAGMPLNVLVNRDLPLMPYRGINQGS